MTVVGIAASRLLATRSLPAATTSLRSERASSSLKMALEPTPHARPEHTRDRAGPGPLGKASRHNSNTAYFHRGTYRSAFSSTLPKRAAGSAAEPDCRCWRVALAPVRPGRGRWIRQSPRYRLAAPAGNSQVRRSRLQRLLPRERLRHRFHNSRRATSPETWSSWDRRPPTKTSAARDS